jgi:hypothetical protein
MTETPDPVKSKLLQGSGVFIDTTEFSNARLDVANPVFVNFAKLCKKGTFHLYTTQITEAEIKRGIENQSKDLCDSIDHTYQFSALLHKSDRTVVEKLKAKAKTPLIAQRTLRKVMGFMEKCASSTFPVGQ